MPTPSTIAAQNLTDYEARIVSRVISPFEGRPELPTGTRQFRGEVYGKNEDKNALEGEWTTSRSEAFHDAERLLGEVEDDLEDTARSEMAQ